MKTKTFRYLVLFFLVLCGSISFPGFSGAEVQTIHFACEDKPAVPMVFGSGEDVNATNPGVAFEVLDMIAQELHLKTKYSRFPWKRELKELQENTVDGVFFASFKESRLEFAEYPMKDGQVDIDKHFMTISYVLYTLKDSPLDWDGSRFIGLTGSIGAPLGYSIVDDLEKMGVSVDPSPHRENNFLKLLRGRVQGVAAQKIFADAYLFFNPDIAQQVEKVSPPLQTKYYYLILSKQFVKTYPELAQQIWDKIEEKRVDGTIDTVIKKYYSLGQEQWGE